MKQDPPENKITSFAVIVGSNDSFSKVITKTANITSSKSGGQKTQSVLVPSALFNQKNSSLDYG